MKKSLQDLPNNRIRILREENYLSQSELAKIVGSKQKTISNYEQGIVEPNLAILRKLSDYFHVSIDYLVCNSNIRNSMEAKDLYDLLEEVINTRDRLHHQLDKPNQKVKETNEYKVFYKES